MLTNHKKDLLLGLPWSVSRLRHKSQNDCAVELWMGTHNTRSLSKESSVHFYTIFHYNFKMPSCTRTQNHHLSDMSTHDCKKWERREPPAIHTNCAQTCMTICLCAASGNSVENVCGILLNKYSSIMLRGETTHSKWLIPRQHSEAMNTWEHQEDD